MEMRQKIGEPIPTFADLLLITDGYGLILDCQFSDSSAYFDFSEQIKNRTLQDILSPSVNEKLTQFVSQLHQKTNPASFELALTINGREYWFDTRVAEISASRFVMSARDITKYKQTEIRMERQLQRISALRSIDFAIASGLDLNLLLSILLDRITETLHVDASDILLLDSKLNELTFAAGKGFTTNVLQYTRLKLGQGCAGHVALDRKMIGISDLAVTKTEFEQAPLFSSEQFIVYYGVPLVAKGRVLGVLEVFHRSYLNPDEDWLDFLNIIAEQAAIAIDSTLMFRDLQRSNFELSLAYNATIDAWSRTLDLRDSDTEGHTRRVTDITIKFATVVGVRHADLIHVRHGATLHDIGKVAIPDRILFKPGPLNQDEWAIMRQHPKYAVDLLSPIKYLEPAMDIPHWHHERWDGAGYPDQLRGEDIPFNARLFSLVDVYDALTSDRPYRSAWSKKDTLQYIEGQSGKLS
ncbi:MAG: HD domain-containing protein [Anaerolineales bacterium]|nr:HD domain-containing protein [Anaerolineales bacterium]